VPAGHRPRHPFVYGSLGREQGLIPGAYLPLEEVAAGAYAVLIGAINTAGQRSSTKRLTFTIVK
jgi:hypothetical protein